MKSIERINFSVAQPTLHAEKDDIERLIDLFLAKKAPALAPVTIENITTRLNYLNRFWAARGADFKWQLTPDVLESYADWLENAYKTSKGAALQFSTRQGILKAARVLLRWAHRNEYIQTNFAQYIPAPKGKPRQHDALELVDLRKMFDRALSERKHIELCALIAVLAGTGIRRRECSFIRVDDVSFADSGGGFIAIKFAKGGEPRTVAFDSVAGRWIHLHIEQNCAGRIWLFESRVNGEQMSGKSINEHLSRLANSAGVEWDGAHAFRRSFATHWLRKLPGDGFAVILARQMGHAVPSMTLGVYNKLKNSDILDVMQRNKCSFFAQAMA